jgi:FtsH-binding integral membrane protein
MDESRSLRRAGWAGAASVVLLFVGLGLCATVGVDDPTVSDADILDRLGDGALQTAGGIGLPMIGAAIALLLWFAVGLRRVLDRLSGGDPLAHAAVPAAALVGGLIITAVSLDMASAMTALSDEFTPDPDIARVLGTAGALVGFTGLTGAAVLVAVTTRIAHQSRALRIWAVWVSYAVVVLCLSGYWTKDTASVAFGLWLIGAVVGVLRTARTPPSDTDPISAEGHLQEPPALST